MARELFIWKKDNEKMLLTEVITIEPYQFKAGTKERGSAWTEIAERLAGCGLKVTQRSVREKFDKLMKDFLKKESEEKKQSGVDVEYGELDQSLQDIKERMAEFEELREGEEQKQKKDKAAAEEMRRQATEKLSETKKRKASLEVEDVDDKYASPSGKRKKTTSMVDVVKETIELKKWQQESDERIKKRELDLRASEMQQQQMFQQSLLQQQHQFQQQQQTLNMSMMSALNELLKVIKK